MPSYDCTICKRVVPYAGKPPMLYPFCSERCRMVDLGHWFREDYAIDRDVEPGELGDSEPGSRDDPTPGEL